MSGQLDREQTPMKAPPNVSKADEILSHIVETDGWYAGCQTLKDYAKSLESSLTQAQGEIERLRKRVAERQAFNRWLVDEEKIASWEFEKFQTTHPQRGDVG